ncbi:hemolysin A [Intrasporangium oryzae NRRL B-24470]|uniref:Hemolysin A n=1 Tax=Intrasporangium oryzae NRRL B-24470 TaxID=1386089 RepID=W9G156_9MICO|nr:TlyA family RNA methyltransferase [Intrasporangium oryzae]EWS99669.1 hemolysin A [Intrasporangium oryzae NRRL B-24470]
MTARRLDVELVARGLARSRTQARELITSGAVLLDGRRATKPAHPVDEASDIGLTREPDRWVGRAALKLLHALETWPIDPTGKRCLDVGASTGGFTQVLLERGAAHVTALDVGHDQLVASLAKDPRVTDLPGTNIRAVDAPSLGGAFDLVVSDLSFISLTIALPAMRPLVADHGDLVVLVKPQFEVGRERLGRRGVVTSSHEHRRVLRDVAGVAADLGLELRGITPSPITGADGNREFLFWLTPATSVTSVTSATPRGAAGQSPVDDMLEAIDPEGDQ